MEGRMIRDAVKAEINPHMTDDRIVVIVALLCGVIAIVGFVSVLPWGRMLRSYESYVATKLANTGLNNNCIDSLPSVVYSPTSSEIPDYGECPICLAEFVEGQKSRVLPKCKHAFHVECVDKWFGSHSSCPTCRNCLLSQEDGVEHFSKNQIQWSVADDSVEEEHRRSFAITDIVVMR